MSKSISDIKFTTFNIVAELPDKKALVYADALLFAVYGWNHNKIGKMKLSSIMHWVELAKKRITWGDAYRLRVLIESKRKSLFQKILLKFKR